MSSLLFRPRAIALLTVPVMGSASERIGQSTGRTTVDFEVPVQSARYTINDFNIADECECEFSYSDVGVDPRLLSNLIIRLYVGNAAGAQTWTPTSRDLRFVGIGTVNGRRLSSEKMTATLKALDYTTLFIGMKPYPADGAPDYTQSLADAWARICDNTGFTDYSTRSIVSSVSVLRDRLVGIPDGIERTIIGTSVLDRVAKLAKIQVGNGDDAWSIWRKCIDSLGLITWISGDQCFVARSAAYYTTKDPPVLQWGSNVLDADESRDLSSINNKGIHLTTFDPVGQVALEAFWPSRDDPTAFRKRLQAAAGKGQSGKRTANAVPGLAPVTDYEHQNYPFPCTQATLDEAAQRIWNERSRQELTGKLTTSDMVVQTQSGKSFDMLGLQHGDQIIVQLEKYAMDAMRRLPSPLARYQYLIGRGFTQSTALLIAKDQGFLDRLLSRFVVKSATFSYDASAPSMKCDVTYLSTINPNTGSTA